MNNTLLTFPIFIIVVIIIFFFNFNPSSNAVEILSKSKLEECIKTETDTLDCKKKVIINLAVPSGSSGQEASIVAELVEVEENDTQKMQTIRAPPIISINKSAAYALYELTYIRDVSYKPEEFVVRTHKCEPDASEKIVKICERLRDENGHIIEHTQMLVYIRLHAFLLQTYILLQGHYFTRVQAYLALWLNKTSRVIN